MIISSITISMGQDVIITNCIFTDGFRTIKFLEENRLIASWINYKFDEQTYYNGSYFYLSKDSLNIRYDDVKNIPCEVNLYESNFVHKDSVEFFITNCPFGLQACNQYLFIKVGRINYDYNANQVIIVPLDSLKNNMSFTLFVRSGYVRYDYLFNAPNEIKNFIHIDIKPISPNLLYYKGNSNDEIFVNVINSDTIEYIVGNGAIRRKLVRTNEVFPNLLIYDKCNKRLPKPW